MFEIVDEAVAAGRFDRAKGRRVVSRVVGGGGVAGWPLVSRAVRSVSVVVVDVVDHEPVELALVPDDGAIKKLASQGADPAFGERVLQTGDRIRIDLRRGRADMLVDEAELQRRRAELESEGGHCVPDAHTP